MFTVFVILLTLFFIIGMLLAWVGNKIRLAILKDNAKAEKKLKKGRKTDEKEVNDCGCCICDYCSSIHREVLQVDQNRADWNCIHL